MWNAGDFANIPSGMGGSFSVKLLEQVEDDFKVEVLNPGFEGWKLTAKAETITKMDEASRQWFLRKEREARELAARQKKRKW